MGTREKIEAAAGRTGWDKDSMLAVLCAYVDNQDDDATLEDYINQQVAEEEGLTEPEPQMTETAAKAVASAMANLVANEQFAISTLEVASQQVEKAMTCANRCVQVLSGLVKDQGKPAADAVIAALEEGRVDTGGLSAVFVSQLEKASGRELHPCPWDRDRRPSIMY